MFLPHFDVFCDLLLNRRTETWDLFVLYNESPFLFQNIQHNSKPAFAPLLPTLAKAKKAIWRNLFSIQNEEISLVTVRSKDWLWLVEENHATVKPDSSVATTKAELNCKI